MMGPGEIRSLILGQHRELRPLLRQVKASAAQVLRQGQGQAVWELRRQVVRLELAFLEHLETEERLLLPVLERIDAWGPVRAGRVRAEHAEQRRMLELAGDRATSPAEAPQDLAQAIITLADDILRDMAHEERDMLDPDLLRDDLISIAQDDG